ncbi:MAG: hypothetical protein KDN20_22920 [Verrucomicrobiae bacterium]|nr:hypothetical protein [Verrucomicrobiae bacterium]
MKLFHSFLPLRPLQPGPMHGDGTTGLKKQIPNSNSTQLITDFYDNAEKVGIVFLMDVPIAGRSVISLPYWVTATVNGTE